MSEIGSSEKKDDNTNFKRKKMSIIYISIASIALLAGVIILSTALYSYLDGLNEAKNLKSLYDKGQQANATAILPTSEEPAAPAAAEDSEALQSTPVPVIEKTILPRYDELLTINEEVIGWIKIDDTRIDYPLLKHDDNEYYLHTSIDGKKSKRGCIYIDYRNSPELLDKNTLIYGHNMKDGSMFKNLVFYKKKDFFDSHRTIHIDNLYEEGMWEVFSVYVVDADKETININYSEEGSFMKAMEGFKNRSMFKTDTQISPDDRIVTLVTCSYETPNSRTIVHAKYIGK